MTDEPPSGPGPRRLLAVTAVPPWPKSNGYSLRAAHFLEQLASDYDITVVSPGPRPLDDPPGSGGIDWIVIDEVPATNTLPWHEDRRRLVEQVERLVRARTFSAALLWNGTEFLAGRIQNLPPTVGDRIDCEALQAWRGRRHGEGIRQKLRSLRRGVEMALYERRALQNLECLVVTGPDDARALQFISRHPRVEVIPNGVELPNLEDLPEEGEVPTIIFTGVLSYGPNVEAARFFTQRVWPEVLRTVPDARFLIAGRSPGPEVRELGEASGVTIRADVPDLTAEIRGAWVAVAPMQSGSGIKNKVLEAWAASRPVVMSELATNGLRLESAPDGLEDLACAGGNQMAQTVVDLLEDGDRRERLGRQARILAEEQHGWAAAARELKFLLEEAMTRSPSVDDVWPTDMREPTRNPAERTNQ